MPELVRVSCASTWPADEPPGRMLNVPFSDAGWQRPGPCAEVGGAAVDVLPLGGDEVVAGTVVEVVEVLVVDGLEWEELQPAARGSATATDRTPTIRRMGRS